MSDRFQTPSGFPTKETWERIWLELLDLCFTAWLSDEGITDNSPKIADKQIEFCLKAF